jgi:hypothetical protein
MMTGHEGACSSTGILKHGEKKSSWPVGAQIIESMPKGVYNARAEIFADTDYCTMDALDTMVKNYAFEVH